MLELLSRIGVKLKLPHIRLTIMSKEVNVLSTARKMCRNTLVSDFITNGVRLAGNPHCIPLCKFLLCQSRETVKWIFKYRTATLATPSWLYKRSLIDSPNCHFCSHANGDIVHIFNTCRGSNLLRLRRELHDALATWRSLNYVISSGNYYKALHLLFNQEHKTDSSNILHIVELSKRFPLQDFSIYKNSES